MKTKKLIKDLSYYNKDLPVVVVFLGKLYTDYYVHNIYQRTSGKHSKNIIIIKRRKNGKKENSV